MELLLSVLSLALAIYERMERTAAKRRHLAESEEPAGFWLDVI